MMTARRSHASIYIKGGCCVFGGLVEDEKSCLCEKIVNEKWEERAQCDIFLHGVTRDGFVIDTIDDTSINVERL